MRKLTKADVRGYYDQVPLEEVLLDLFDSDSKALEPVHRRCILGGIYLKEASVTRLERMGYICAALFPGLRLRPPASHLPRVILPKAAGDQFVCDCEDKVLFFRTAYVSFLDLMSGKFDQHTIIVRRARRAVDNEICLSVMDS